MSRNLHIARLTAAGYTGAEIAEDLGLSETRIWQLRQEMQAAPPRDISVEVLEEFATFAGCLEESDIPLIEEPHKTCSACSESLPLSAFYLQSRTAPDGSIKFYGECKKCHHARTSTNQRNRRDRDPEYAATLKANSRRWARKAYRRKQVRAWIAKAAA